MPIEGIPEKTPRDSKEVDGDTVTTEPDWYREWLEKSMHTDDIDLEKDEFLEDN